MPRSGVAVLLALALATSACPGSPPPPRPRETPVPGGTLTAVVRDLASLDPAKASGQGALLAVAQIFDSLTAYDPPSRRIVPAAADKWDVSADGRSWRFHLRQATFHDGSPVTARSFKLAFDRIVRRATASDAAFQLEPVAGFDAAKFGSARGLDGVVAEANDLLVVRLSSPFAELPAALSHPALGPVTTTFAADPRARPAGNGPFRVTEFTPAESATLVRYDAHSRASSYLDSLKLRIVGDANEGWREFEAGKADIAELPQAVAASEAGRYGRAGLSSFWAAVYYGPNLRLAKYRHPEVRRALSYAIDREAIARVVYGGAKDPADGIIPRGTRGYATGACRVCAPNRARAREILSRLFPSALYLSIDHLDAPLPRSEASAIAADLRAVGVKVTLRAHSAAAYQALLKAGRQDFAELGWLAEVSSPDSFLAQQLRSGSRNNPTGFADPRFDYLIDQARAQRDDAARQAAYRRAEARALEQMPLIPIVFFRNRIAVSARVRGFALDGAGVFDAASVWLAPAA